VICIYRNQKGGGGDFYGCSYLFLFLFISLNIYNFNKPFGLYYMYTVCNAACSIAHSIICTRPFCGKMHSDWFNRIEILQSRWQHGEKVGYFYPSGLEKTLCKWDIYVPLVTKGLTRRKILVCWVAKSGKCYCVNRLVLFDIHSRMLLKPDGYIPCSRFKPFSLLMLCGCSHIYVISVTTWPM